MKNFFVLHSDGTKEKFKPRLISETIIRETDVDEDIANKIQRRISHRISVLKQDGVTEISTSDLRAEVSSQLLKEGEIDALERNRVLGMTVNEFEDLMENGCKDNANINYSPEMITKYSYDSIAKQYALQDMPKECAQAHIDGFVHHHDLEFFHTRPNCMNMDLRFFAKNGLKIDGHGLMGSVAKPAKSLEVMLNHMLQAWMAGAVVFSGGQGYINFNTLLAPFAKDRSYEDIKQAIQAYIFNCNMSLVCRGGQILFSSIGVDLSIPDVLKDEPAIGPNGVANGTYKDYQEEADLIFRAVLEVSEEKDGNGAYHRFPNILINIREGDLDEYEGNCRLLHEKGANNPTLYYVNCVEMERTVMGALTSDTPVMTNEGFKYPQNLSIGDEVMTYAEDGSKEWNKIYNIIPKIAPDKVYKITLDNNYQFKVTDNHKLPTNEGIVKSEDLKVGMELYDYVDEPFIPIDDYKAEFMGVFLADGYIRDSERINGRSSNKIEFHIKQKWKKDKIIKLCLLNGYKYELIEREDDNTYIIYVNEKELRNQLNECYDCKGNKHFPTWIWNDKNVVANVIKGLMFDGRKGSKVRWDWSCSDLPLVIDVLYALSYIGRISTIYVDDRKGDTGNWRTNYRISFGLDYKPKNKTKIKSIELVDNDEMVYDLSIENNHNYVCGLGGIHSENCRTALPMNYAGNYKDDCCNTGNFMYSTLNLPLIALESNGDRQKFYNLLGNMCDIIYDTLIYRRNCVIDTIYNKHMSDFLLQEDKETGEPLWDIDRTTITIGYCGLYECLEILNDVPKNHNSFNGEEILNFINSKKELYNEKDGLRWSVIGSPAESASHRFAEIIKEKYPYAPVQGIKGSYYLTNSSHIPVSHNNNIIDHIKNAAIYHPLSLGGNILHIWSGEVYSDAKAIWSLNKKILETGIIFWAYSKVFTFCQECGFTINDNVDECLICKSKALTTYDRCFSGDTKIFIKKGKIIKPIQLKDFVENYNVKEWKVPVFDSNQQKYIWCSVKRGIKNPIEDMIKIDFNKGYSVTCTPNHNFFKYQMSRTKSMYDTIPAKELHVKDKISNHRCPELVTNVSENVLGTFIGFVLGDGTFVNSKGSKNIGIRLKCHKSDKRDYIEWLLKSNDLDYTFSIGSDDRYESTTTYSFYIGASNIGNIAYDMFNKYSNKRDIIDECYNEDLMLGVFAGLINSDGSVLLGRKNQVITTFNQVDRKVLYLFYWIGMLLGVNPSLSFTERKSYKSLGRIEMSSFKMYELLQIIHLREPFNSNVLKGECRSDARNVNGMCSIKSMSEAPKQESYCIEVEHSDHNTIFNGVLAQNCTGYYLPTNGFNNGKKQEFKDRYRHAI